MSEPVIVIREARGDEAEVFLGLVEALADYEKLGRPEPAARERLIRDGFGPEPKFRPHLAELDGRVVGYAITFYTYSSFLALPTLYLEDVFVLPDARRFGVGRAFFRALARRAVEEGCGRMEWVVLDWNELAIDFYETLGARRMSDWYTYRLDRRRLEEIAGEAG